MSGSAPTLGPLPLKLYEKEWQQLCTKCGIEEDDPEKRLEKLRALSPEQIIEDYLTAAMADGVVITFIMESRRAAAYIALQVDHFGGHSCGGHHIR